MKKEQLSSRREIVELLQRVGKPLSLDRIAAELNLSGADSQSALAGRLTAMERDGQLLQGRRGRYGLAQKMDLYAGRVVGHRDGYGFVICDLDVADLYLSPKEMRKVFHGDRVLAAIIRVDRRGRREGSIVEVLERAHQQVVGRYQQEFNTAFVIPEDRRLSQDILVTPPAGLTVADGDLVVVELTRQPQRKRRPQGEVVEVLGAEVTTALEIDLVLRKFDIPAQWDQGVAAEIDRLPGQPGTRDLEADSGLPRVDLRELPLVTIDGEDARDFDDAVYAEQRGEGWRLAVAIADVSHYVRPGSVLDQQAYQRGTSVYFPDRVVPMLPEVLSNGLCSLIPGEDRLAMVCWMDVSADGEITDYRFEPALIHSHSRLTYNQVWQFLEQGVDLPVGDKSASDVIASLLQLDQLYRALDHARQRRGALDFDSREVQVVMDDRGSVEQLAAVQRNRAHKIIEECMVAANRCAAEWLDELKIPTLHRAHDRPDGEKIIALRQTLGALQLKLEGDEQPTTHQISRLLCSLEGRADGTMIQMMVLRSLKQAVYTPAVAGHFGMGLEHYTHFTSPIRRYPDLLVHRALKKALNGKRKKDYPYTREQMVEMGEHCSMTERRAEDASRDLVAAYKCRFMADHVGEEFEGMVSGVTAFGLFITLDQGLVDGLIHVSSLKNDYYHYDPVMQRLTAEHSQERFALGDRMMVKVVRVDVQDRKIDFELVCRV